MHTLPNRREVLVSATALASAPAVAGSLLSGPVYAQAAGIRDLSSSTAQIDAYMGAPVELVTAPNGAIANRRLVNGIDKVAWVEPTIEQPTEGIWVFGGYGLAPMGVIDTDEGLICFDTGDTKHDGELMFEALRTVSDKPVKAIIYGHSHTCFGAGVLAEGNDDITVIGHPELNAVVARNAGGSPAYFPEIGPYLTARALIQFNAFMPDKGPDAYVVPTTLVADEGAFIPVNTPVEDGQEMTVLGQKLQFFTKYGSDDKVHTTVWLPDRKVLFTTMLWSSPPQFYSVRGDVFRDPRKWITGLKFNRDLQPEVLVSAACRPVVGKENIQKTLEGYLDGASFVLDQSLRGILGGKGPDELRHFVKFPEYLNGTPNNLQNYGEISSYPPAIHYQCVGWYDNDAANLKPISPEDESARIVPLMGGRDAVLAAAREALAEKEYSWAAQLVNYLYRLNPEDAEVRQVKADTLRQMAYVSTGANDRAHLMSQALALEGKVTIPRIIPPTPEVIAAAPTVYADYFRVRIDPTRSGETDRVLRFDFSDGSSAGLGHAHPGIDLLPAIERRFRYPHFSTDLANRRSGFRLPQCKGNLFVAESFLRHRYAPLLPEMYPKFRTQFGPVSGGKTSSASSFRATISSSTGDGY